MFYFKGFMTCIKYKKNIHTNCMNMTTSLKVKVKIKIKITIKVVKILLHN